ncbi:MBL fold metallo-hydrolase [Halomarina litorea]|uniref:MBL fold metallo-hydrolase n=1 Tax=Halomarina litorea TaxID=2961595 RepID=UPI0020C5427C|nr:MBL fold metallo-hydrolase [Halomarina sp. BCD28]
MDGHADTSSVHRIEYPVDWPPGHVASYLVECEDTLTLVDAGMPGPQCESVLRGALADRNFDVADLDCLVLTHPHVDHVGQVGTVLDEADPTVYVPAGVGDRFERDLDDLETAVRETATAAGLTDDQLEGAVSMAVESLRRNRGLLPPERVDHWVREGDPFEVGGTRVEPIHTPGHQADHCCYHLPESGVLVAGDMAIEPFRPVALHAGLDREVDEAIDAFYAALDRLDDLAETDDPRRVLPGHGPAHADLAGVVRRDRESLDRMLDRTVEAVRNADEPPSALDVTEGRVRDRGIEYIVAEVVGALRHLESAGRLESETVDGVRRYSLPEDASPAP